MNVQISPSILSADFSKLGEEIRAVEQAGADMLHLDIMDGHFVPNITFGPTVVAAIKSVATVPLDVHLMIENPDSYIDEFASVGADILTLHVESCMHMQRALRLIRSVQGSQREELATKKAPILGKMAGYFRLPIPGETYCLPWRWRRFLTG